MKYKILNCLYELSYAFLMFANLAIFLASALSGKDLAIFNFGVFLFMDWAKDAD